MHRAFVTGANGFIGTALTRRLLQEGAAVRAMCRTAANGKHLAEAGAEVVPGDVQDSSGLEKQMRNCDVVFHVAAVMGSAPYSYNVNVAGTRNVIESAHKAGVSRFVHVSTVAIYGYHVEGIVGESYPQRPSRDDFYQQSKAIGETVVWNYAQKSGLPTACIRPAMVYGPGSSFWSGRLYDLCRRFPVPLLEGGQGNAHPIFVDDVVDLMVTLATHQDAPGHSFHAAPDPAPSWAEFLGYYARMAHNTATLKLPYPLLKPVGAAMTTLLRLIGQPYDLAGTLYFWRHRATFSMAKARIILDWQPHYDLPKGMALTQPWLEARTSAG